MSDVALLSKYQIVPGEDPEVTSLRLHNKKNRPVNQAEEMGLEFPVRRFPAPYPTAMYRDWDSDDERDNEIYRLAAKHNLDLEKRRDRMAALAMVGAFKTINVGVTDFIAHPNGEDEVISEVRERNDRQHKAMQDAGWADTPDGVPAAKRAWEIRTKAAPAAQILFEDRRLSPKARAEFDTIDDAADDHITDVNETRKALQDAGTLPKAPTPAKRGRKAKAKK